MPSRVVKLLSILVFLFFPLASSYPFNWQILHEKSESMTLEEAKLNSRTRGSLEDSYILGLVYFNQYKDSIAQKVFNNILVKNPKNIEARWGKAEVMRRRYKIDISQRLLEKIIKEDPSFFPAYLSLAYIKYNLHDYITAAKLAQVVIKSGLSKVDRCNLAKAYLISAAAKGMIVYFSNPISKIIYGPDILISLKKAEQLTPDAASVYFGLGSFYLLAPVIAGKDIEKAKYYLEKTIAKDSLFADAYVRLAQVYKVKGDQIKYFQLINKALELDPNNFLVKDIKNRECKFICPEK